MNIDVIEAGGGLAIYPNAPHGFHADYRDSYRKEAAEDGWKRLQAWFKKYGVA
jgi:carboxymethylenebutenolidase